MEMIVDGYATEKPDDVSGLEKILKTLPIDEINQLALVGKSEGTATINDFSRELALRTVKKTIILYGGEKLLNKSTLIFSTGCEGVISPFVYVLASFNQKEEVKKGPSRLVMGTSRTEKIPVEELATHRHVYVIGKAVREAMDRAGLSSPEVSLVLVKSPILTHLEASKTTNAKVLARAGSSGLSRGAAGLGVALALGEIEENFIKKINIGLDFNYYSRRAMCFSGTEVNFGEILILGNRPGVRNRFKIFSKTMDDILDARSLRELFKETGCLFNTDGELATAKNLLSVFLKVGVSSDGRVRDERTTIYQSELDPDKHMRAVASGVIGGILGTGKIFVSGGTEHQAPPGGGLCACIADVSSTGSTS
jgi:cyanuric acid amidohydrolase